MDDTISIPPNDPPQKWPPILTPKQLSLYLQIALSTVYKKVYRDEIPHVKKGGILRFIKADIDRWLKGR